MVFIAWSVILLGPLVAIIVSTKYAEMIERRSMREVRGMYKDIQERLDGVILSQSRQDQEILMKTKKLVMPIAMATEQLQEVVGIK
jgi:uncharacterized membrane protein (DUF106 family)